MILTFAGRLGSEIIVDGSKYTDGKGIQVDKLEKGESKVYMKGSIALCLT